jgi:hypothetical protein
MDAQKLRGGKRPHELYNDTYYIPNDKLRLLEIPMNRNLTFQMLLYYHQYYDILYGCVLIPCGLYKIMLGGTDELIFVSCALNVIFCITEYFRLQFGFNGNINESFPELIAFLIQSILFNLPFLVVPLIAKYRFPFERMMGLIGIFFITMEIIVGIGLSFQFFKT